MVAATLVNTTVVTPTRADAGNRPARSPLASPTPAAAPDTADAARLALQQSMDRRW